MHIHNTAGDDDETDNDDNRVGWMKVGGGNKSDESVISTLRIFTVN